VEPELNLYARDWPIWTYQTQHPPAKFIFDDEGRRGEAIDSLISAGCILSGGRVKRSILFFLSRVEEGSLVKDSVILPKVQIGRNCVIKRAVIDKSCVIPDGMQIGVDLEEDAKRFHVTPNGIVLVTPNMLGQNLYSLEGEDHLWTPES
jgi:glucose-1-phosphate adenylyltransferase